MTLHQVAASVISKCLRYRRNRILTVRWQHVSECLICCHVWKRNLSVGVAGADHFVCVHKLARNGCWLRRICRSVCLSVHIGSFVSERFFLKFYIGDFMQIIWWNSNFTHVHENIGTLHEALSASYCCRRH